jgi:hypothetical protein
VVTIRPSISGWRWRNEAKFAIKRVTNFVTRRGLRMQVTLLSEAGSRLRPAATSDLHRPSTGSRPALDHRGGSSTSKSVNREGSCDG